MLGLGSLLDRPRELVFAWVGREGSPADGIGMSTNDGFLGNAFGHTATQHDYVHDSMGLRAGWLGMSGLKVGDLRNAFFCVAMAMALVLFGEPF